MARSRMKKYSRRTSNAGRRSNVPLAVLCVVIFLVLCFAIAVVIGVLLGKKADDIPNRIKYDFPKVEYQSGGKTVKSIEGYHFAKGASAADYYAQGIYDFSFCLRHADGSLDHLSVLAAETGFDEQGAESLAGVVNSIHTEGGRACGYFYVRAFSEQSEHLREVLKAYELSLIAEMSDSGIDEILLVGLDVSDQNIGEIEEFLAKASLSSEKAAIGAVVSLDMLELTENEVYHAARIKQACDFMAIDLCHLTLDDTLDGKDEDGERVPGNFEKLIDENEYYIKAYKARLVFSREYSAIYKTALELGVSDFQIIGK